MTDTAATLDAPAKDLPSLNVEEIMSYIPHRPPFLFIDRLVDIVPGVSAVGIKQVTMNEPFFAGHFPGHPVMPGVIQIEAMAQTAGALIGYAMGKGASKGKVTYFLTIDEARFRQPVYPGDTLRLQVELIKERGQLRKFSGTAFVDGKRVSNGIFSAMIVDA